MTEFIQQVVNGLSLGSIFALIALGYTMVYGIIKLINFAHGEMYMIGAYTGYLLITKLQVNFIVAILGAMLVCAILGIIIERVAYKPLRNSPRITSLITAIGMSIFLQYTVMYFMGADTRSVPNSFENTVYHFGEVTINTKQIIIIATTIILMLILQFIVNKTKIGRAMRAVSVNMEAAELCGVNVNRTISITFALGSALAGAAGVLVGMYYNSIDPLMGAIVGLKAFIAAVFGGIGIIPGALLGGEFIGLAETFVSGYWSSTFKDLVVYAILIIILIFKPSGILGKNKKEKV